VTLYCFNFLLIYAKILGKILYVPVFSIYDD